jgi:hypothetical protein
MSEARTFFAGTSDNLMNQIFFLWVYIKGENGKVDAKINFKKKFLKNEI